MTRSINHILTLGRSSPLSILRRSSSSYLLTAAPPARARSSPSTPRRPGPPRVRPPSCLLWVLHKRVMAIHALIGSFLKDYLQSGKERDDRSRQEHDRRVTEWKELRTLRGHWWLRVGKWLRICRAG